VLTPAQRAQLFAADEATRVAVAVAQTNAENTGLLGDEGTNLAAVETARRAYNVAREKLTRFLERADYPSDAEVAQLLDLYGTVGDFRALNAGLAASSLGGALVGTVADTARTVVTPALWPPWMKWGAGTVVALLLAVTFAPMVLGAAARSMFGGRR
jgi:hypothetical protein